MLSKSPLSFAPSEVHYVNEGNSRVCWKMRDFFFFWLWGGALDKPIDKNRNKAHKQAMLGSCSRTRAWSHLGVSFSNILEDMIEVGQRVWTEPERSGIYIEYISTDRFVSKSECFLFILDEDLALTSRSAQS